MSNRPKIISATEVSKSYWIDQEKQSVLGSINFSVNTGDFVCIVGPSGCGKSTLLRIIAGLTRPGDGLIKINPGTKLAMVFQNFALFPWLTVEENIGFGLEMAGKSKRSIRAIVSDQIKNMGLSGMGEKHPKELSGGMKQRVGIARALAVEPQILLLDEPFSALDVFTAKKLRRELIQVWKKHNLTVMMVSHLVEEAVELADKIIVMSARPGNIKKIITNDLERPRDTRSKEFFSLVDGIENLIQG